MTNDKDLRQEILAHLKLYKDLGVRWVQAGKAQVPAASAGFSGRRGPQKPRTAGWPEQKSPPAPPVTKYVSQSATQKTLDSVSSLVKSASGDETLDSIRADLKDCKRCKLSPTRKNIVFGSGNPNAELMFVGEAPGADEDEQGLPFVGRAGQLLTKIIEAIDLNRNDVFICNILKCRPPGNRNPEADEIAACEQFLFRQIASVKPQIICALGAFGAQTLLRTTESIGRLRGRLIDYRGVKLIATFHPAYLLRNPNEKRKVWEDMLVVRRYLESLH
jgi:DNA polymerase